MRSALSVVSLLTIIPAPGGTLEGAARHMYFFPAVGALVGAVAGVVGAALSLIDPLVGGIGAAAALMVLTGLHHADGLADLADGLMAGPKRALTAMRDSATGTAGTVAVSLSAAALAALAAAAGGGAAIFAAVAVSEILAKMCIVVVARAGRPAAPGSGAEFMRFASWPRVAGALALALVPAWLVFGYEGLAAAAAAGAAALVLAAVASRRVGGVTGDVLGASNEAGRLASLAVLVS